MHFPPKSKAELKPAIADGEYPATVCKAENKISKAGNEMVALTLRVHVGDGSVLVNDWLLSVPTGLWKIHDFCEAAGLGRQYESGQLQPEDCIGAEVFVKVASEDGGKYGIQPRIKAYLKERSGTQPGSKQVQAASATQGKRARAEAEDRRAESAAIDDIPF